MIGRVRDSLYKSGKITIWRDVFTIFEIADRSWSRTYFRSVVGIGSKLQNLDGDLAITVSTSSQLTLVNDSSVEPYLNATSTVKEGELFPDISSLRFRIFPTKQLLNFVASSLPVDSDGRIGFEVLLNNLSMTLKKTIGSTSSTLDLKYSSFLFSSLFL